MLNPTFPKHLNTAVGASYVAPQSTVNRSLLANEAFDTGREYRLQTVYGDEIWLKLKKAGFTPSALANLSVLEVCAGTGFLTYHLLSKVSPKNLTVNDISPNELDAGRQLISAHYPQVTVEYVLGDMHEAVFDRKFDLIIGNSFLHHFHDVPAVLSRFGSLLNEGGSFISLHEPTPMSTVVESAKMLAFPLAVVAPGLVNDIARARYKGEPSATDIWMFEAAGLRNTAKAAGFKSVTLYPWHLVRTILVQKRGLHLSAAKPHLLEDENRALRRSIQIDSLLSEILPARFFGSICLVCKN